MVPVSLQIVFYFPLGWFKNFKNSIIENKKSSTDAAVLKHELNLLSSVLSREAHKECDHTTEEWLLLSLSLWCSRFRCSCSSLFAKCCVLFTDLTRNKIGEGYSLQTKKGKAAEQSNTQKNRLHIAGNLRRNFSLSKIHYTLTLS